MTQASNNKEPIAPPAWSAQLYETMRRNAVQQLVSEKDSYRLLALALLVMLQNHAGMSGHATSDTARLVDAHLQDLLQLANADDDEATPPTLEEIGIIMDMSATGFSMLDARRSKLQIQDKDIKTEEIADALKQLMIRAANAGGVSASATLARLILSSRC